MSGGRGDDGSPVVASAAPPARSGRRRLGVLSTFVWDVIHGRDPRDRAVEEWGGVAYSLAALDAALPDDWEIVPIMKVGSDLAPQATRFVRSLRRMAPDAALVEVPYPNQRVELRYVSAERRTETLSGGVPGWSWVGLKPLLDDAGLDALYVNFLSGWELDLATMQMVRRHFPGPIYCDLHMLVWSVQPGGLRTLAPLADVAEWCRCFDFLQVNEEEVSTLAPDPMALAATALASGVRALHVTLGSRGVVYFAAPGFARLADREAPAAAESRFGPVRTALVPAAAADGPGDPTGCGDVWGATYFSRLVAGDNLVAAMQAANRAAARNVAHRGATGLASFLRGELSRP